jgi:hypothetical protein
LMMNSFELSTAHHTSWSAPTTSPLRATTILFAVVSSGAEGLRACVGDVGESDGGHFYFAL